MSRRILVVGLCCLDIVHFVDKFPAEDSDTRVFERNFYKKILLYIFVQTRPTTIYICTAANGISLLGVLMEKWNLHEIINSARAHINECCLGGNAANNVTVLKQLNENYELFASLPEDDTNLEASLRKVGINTQRCIRRPGAECPISTVIVNRSNGTRTILHYRGSLPEIDATEFRQTFGESLNEFSWIHFEGRNFGQIKTMMEFVREKQKLGKATRISVELEKIRPYSYLEKLIPLADVIFVSKDYAKHRGWHSMTEAVEKIHCDAPGSTVICPWGEKGVAGRKTNAGEMIVQPSFPPLTVVDTLAAGDCFIGASLHFLNNDCMLIDVLCEASKIAGKKCGQKGLLNLVP